MKNFLNIGKYAYTDIFFYSCYQLLVNILEISILIFSE